MGMGFRSTQRQLFFFFQKKLIPVVAKVLSELKILVICFYLFLTSVLHLKINI